MKKSFNFLGAFMLFSFLSFAQADTLKKTLTVKDNNIAALEDDEKYSNRDVYLKLFRYKLDENFYTGAKNINSYAKFTSNFYDRINPTLDKKDLKKITDFCSQVPKTNDLQAQIWNIENKIKKTINKTVNRTKAEHQFKIGKLALEIIEKYKKEKATETDFIFPVIKSTCFAIGQTVNSKTAASYISRHRVANSQGQICCDHGIKGIASFF